MTNILKSAESAFGKNVLLLAGGIGAAVVIWPRVAEAFSSNVLKKSATQLGPNEIALIDAGGAVATQIAKGFLPKSVGLAANAMSGMLLWDAVEATGVVSSVVKALPAGKAA